MDEPLTIDRFADELEAGTREFEQQVWSALISPYITMYGNNWCLTHPAIRRVLDWYKARR